MSDHRVREKRRQAEKALASLRRQYELILNSAGEGIYSVDLDGNINFHASLRTGATQRVNNDVFWRKDGKSFRVDYVSAPIKDEGGQTVGAIVTFRDITERKRAEKRLIRLLSIGISRVDRPK